MTCIELTKESHISEDSILELKPDEYRFQFVGGYKVIYQDIEKNRGCS